MKQKINLLIAFSAVVLVALTVMQYYLVRTAYDYKVAEFRTEIKEKIAKVTNDYSDIDSTIFQKKDLLYKELAESYLLDPQRKASIKQSILQNSFKAELTRKLQLEFEREIPNLELDFAIVLDKFIIYNNSETDTVFAEKPFIENKMYGNLASLDHAFLVRNYVGTTSGSGLNSDYKLLTEDTLYVSVNNWEMIVMKRMSAIFAFAVFAILTLITLFVIAIKALIKQKKISDIKTDFINNITHELKTPLTTLSVSTKILGRQEVRDNDTIYNNVLDTINRQNHRLQNLIDQVMTNALGHAEIELHKENVCMPEFLNTVVSDFKMAYPDVAVFSNFEPKKTMVNLDKFHLTTALINVLENAVKYGCTNITVSTTIEEGQFQIAIKDDGIGIPKNKHSLLFDKFYRVERGNLHNAKGLGLGLYYVDQIAKAHKGTVDVVSELGKGATFRLRLECLSN